MHIAYDYQIFSLQKYGGISRYFYELARNIANLQGGEVSVISPLYINAYLEAEGNLRIVGRRMAAAQYASYVCHGMSSLLSPILMMRAHPDVVHETYYSASRIAPKGSKVVLTVFDMIHERFPKDFPTRDRTSRNKAIAVERADHVICISEQTRNDLMDIFNVNPSKISVVHLGFSLPPCQRDVVMKSGRPYLLYVGSRIGYKNFEGLLRAYAADPDLMAMYDIVAFGGGQFNMKERKLIKMLGIPEIRVRHEGGSDTILSDLYSGAELFVYPSLYEGFGIPPLEAMSFDCPVVCSNTGSLPEVVGNAAELFDPRSPESIGAAIGRVLNSAVLRQSLIASGRNRIRLFSWERCARQTMNVYQSVLS